MSDFEKWFESLPFTPEYALSVKKAAKYAWEISAASRDARIKELEGALTGVGLYPLTGSGQIKKGDTLVFFIGGIETIEKAVVVIAPGTDSEEIVWDKKHNRYFITVNVLDDGKYQNPYLTKVRVLRASLTPKENKV